MTSQQDIDLACQSFQQSVNKLFLKLVKSKRKKYDNSVDEEGNESLLIRDSKQCANHANYVLKTLYAKRTSLRYALKAFETATQNYLKLITSASLNKDLEQRILRRWFGIFLRLRDGFVLLESGERRHPGDDDDDKLSTNNAQHKLFSSRLSNGGAYRQDGKTRKFSSEKGYTGAGWDEIFDEDVGVRKRLLDALIGISGGGGVGGMARMESLRNELWEKLLDRGAGMWDMEIDKHTAECSVLRGQHDSIRKCFEDGMNQYLIIARQNDANIPARLVLVTDDKAERMTLGPLEIRREGNVFTLNDKGGSLPIGMTLEDWEKIFELGDPSSSLSLKKKAISLDVNSSLKDSQKVTKKKRLVIEDSSSEDEDEKNHPPKKAKNEPPPKRLPTTLNGGESNNDGLLVTVRKATNSTGSLSLNHTHSLDEIKRQHGVSTSQLEQGFEQLDKEQLQSSIVANEEELMEGFLGDDVFRNISFPAVCGSTSKATFHAEQLQTCIRNLLKLRQHLQSSKSNAILFEDGDLRDLWEDLSNLLNKWKEDLKELTSIGMNISKGRLTNTSDDTYKAREHFREINMLLGNLLLEMHEFLSSQNQQLCETASSSTQTTTSMTASLSTTATSFLRAAEEAFNTALSIAVDLESSQANSGLSIERQWVKGQHFLLRGRAQTNIGISIFEQAQSSLLDFTAAANVKQQLSRAQMTKAADQFHNAVETAKKLRHNTVTILSDPNAKMVSTHNKHSSWKAEAMKHSLEAIELSSLASRYLGMCMWKLDRMQKSKDIFFESADTSEILQLVGCEGVSPLEIVSAFCGGYWSVMTLAELSTKSLEVLPTIRSEVSNGEEMLVMTSQAMKRACEISDELFSFSTKHSVEDSIYKEYNIATRAQIETEEHVISEFWKTKKARSQQNLANERIENEGIADNLPRRDVAGLGSSRGELALPTRRIFLQEGSAILTRSRRSKKNNAERRREEERAAADSFNVAFCSNDDTCSTLGASSAVTQTNEKIFYRKWGDEISDENDSKMYPGCCPPLPPDMPPDLRREYEAKYAAILPKMSDAEVERIYATVKLDSNRN